MQRKPLFHDLTWTMAHDSYFFDDDNKAKNKYYRGHQKRNE